MVKPQKLRLEVPVPPTRQTQAISAMGKFNDPVGFSIAAAIKQQPTFEYSFG
jgi:hypothetical protein